MFCDGVEDCLFGEDEDGELCYKVRASDTFIKTKKRTQTKKINSESLLLAAQFIPSNKQFIQKADSEDDGTVTI